MSYTRKVAFNTAAQMLGKVLGTAISIATVAALFRYFGVEGMGKYTTVFAFVAFFSVFADFENHRGLFPGKGFPEFFFPAEKRS